MLKPYFAKVLGSRTVEVSIRAEFEMNKVVAQLATSTDLENIDRQIIESVHFKFVEKSFFGKKFNFKNGTNETEEGMLSNLYSSEKDLLEEILENRNVKHYLQLRYLAANHCGKILKLRFVLNPFSFVFLLSGDHRFHMVLETLDTEEATYVWHIDKGFIASGKIPQAVESALNIIRHKGRQAYLESRPVNFGRIIHDYTDDRKGFVHWRDMLEEKLY